MNLLQFLNHQAGGNKRFHIDKRADGWRIKPRSFSQYLDNDNVVKTLQGVDGIESAKLEKCSLAWSLDDEAVIVRTTIRPKEIEIPNFNGGKVKITEDIHYSSCFGIRPTQDVWLHIGTNFGDRIDYVNTRKGNRIRLSPELSINLGRHMYFSIHHTFEKMDVNEERLYTANISHLSAVYHINEQIFLRTIIQYVDYDYNVGNYIEERDSEYKKLFAQFLFSYKINPFTVFFLGYSDNRYGSQDYNLTQNDRTFFAKLSYAWVL